MKKYKEIIMFFIFMYVSCIIVKIIMNKFSFNVEYLRDSIFNAVGVTLGWYGCDYIRNKKSEQKVNKK